MREGRETIVAETAIDVTRRLKLGKLAILASERHRDIRYGDLQS